MTSDDTDTATARIPADTESITLVPAFGGGYIIRFNWHGGGYLGDPITAPAGVTFGPDGTVTWPHPFADPAA